MIQNLIVDLHDKTRNPTRIYIEINKQNQLTNIEIEKHDIEWIFRNKLYSSGFLFENIYILANTKNVKSTYLPENLKRLMVIDLQNKT